LAAQKKLQYERPVLPIQGSFGSMGRRQYAQVIICTPVTLVNESTATKFRVQKKPSRRGHRHPIYLLEDNSLFWLPVARQFPKAVPTSALAQEFLPPAIFNLTKHRFRK
jgi:hypothetical protein